MLSKNVVYSFYNVCNTIQGLPALLTAYTIKNGGYYAIATFCLIAILTNYICEFMLDDSEDNNQVEYEELSRLAYGEKFYKLTTVLLFVQLLLVSSLYPLILGELLNEEAKNYLNNCSLYIMLGVFLVVWNVLLSNLEQVSWTSILTILSSLIICFYLMFYSYGKKNLWGNLFNHQVKIANMPLVISTQLECYLAQPFIIMLRKEVGSLRTFKMSMRAAFITMTAISLVSALMADILFYPDTKSAITTNLDHNLFTRMISIISAFMVIFSYTLPIYSCFVIVEKNLTDNKVVLQNRLIIVGLSAAIPAFLPFLPVVSGFVGSITGPTLQIIIPAIIHLKLNKGLNSTKKVAMCVLVAFGLFMVVLGIIGTSYFFIN